MCHDLTVLVKYLSKSQSKKTFANSGPSVVCLSARQ
jgi:hypothetical protein